MKPALYHYFELISLVISIICLARVRYSIFTWFIPYLFLVLVAELFANYSFYVLHLPTGWIYNILNPVSQTFYSYVFYHLVKNKSHKLFILISNSVYIACYIIYYSIFSIDDFSKYLIVIGGIQQVLFAGLFFYGCLQDDNLIEVQINSGIWISAGVLIFYSGITICISLIDYIERNKITLAGVPLYNAIPRFLSIILYTCLSVSFIKWNTSIKIKA